VAGRGRHPQRAGLVVTLLALAVALTVSPKMLFGLPRPAGVGTALLLALPMAGDAVAKKR
jgi:hypothetical protein